MIRDYTSMAVGNLMHRKTRSWLTLLGIFIGIAAVVALISLGQGLQHAITSEFMEMGADKLMITAKSLGFSTTAQTENDLRERDLRAIERTSGVLRATGYNQRTVRAAWGGDTVQFLPVLSYSDDPLERQMLQDFFTVKLEEGRELSQGDTTKVIIGNNLADPEDFDRPLRVGDKVDLNGTRFEVVGVFDKTGDPLADKALFMTHNGHEAIFGEEDRFTGIVAQTEPGVDVNVVAESVRQQLRSERGLDEGDENFEIQTPEELIESFNEIFGIVQFVIIGIAAISLVVGGVGIMNTMYTAVLERTKEIGIMKAIGSTNESIMLLFLIESGLLGLVGGAIGVLLGLGLAKVTEYIGKTTLDTTLLSAWFSWWLVVGALAFAFIVGVVSGVLPARQASRQKPVDSLRYE